MPMVGRTMRDYENLQLALQAAIDLLSFYAQSLNTKDGGNRKTYKTIEEWMKDAGPK